MGGGGGARERRGHPNPGLGWQFVCMPAPLTGLHFLMLRSYQVPSGQASQPHLLLSQRRQSLTSHCGGSGSMRNTLGGRGEHVGGCRLGASPHSRRPPTAAFLTPTPTHLDAAVLLPAKAVGAALASGAVRPAGGAARDGAHPAWQRAARVGRVWRTSSPTAGAHGRLPPTAADPPLPNPKQVAQNGVWRPAPPTCTAACRPCACTEGKAARPACLSTAGRCGSPPGSFRRGPGSLQGGWGRAGPEGEARASAWLGARGGGVTAADSQPWQRSHAARQAPCSPSQGTQAPS